MLVICFTVNHLDAALPVWLWIQTNEGGDRHCKGNYVAGQDPMLGWTWRRYMQSNNLRPLFILCNLTEDICWFPSPPWVTLTHPLPSTHPGLNQCKRSLLQPAGLTAPSWINFNSSYYHQAQNYHLWAGASINDTNKTVCNTAATNKSSYYCTIPF